MKIAVIPARGGSKRIPGKNIKDFCGRPMIGWAIENAQRSSLFDHVIVSTDDSEIAETAIQLGAEVPFFRPKDLADDFTPTVPVIAHATQACISEGWKVEHVCCIYPCAPLLQVTDLISALELLVSEGVNFTYPVTEYAHPVQRAMRQRPDGKMQFIDPDNAMGRTQDMEKTYHDTGQFYWGKSTAWLARGNMHTDGLGMRIPGWRVVDIDTEDDWRRAELLFRTLQTMPPDWVG
jgi:pseudaminic acid cytidylyltransferase